ncbi:MAG TPA: ROK family protein [Burkholderiaceae bacterium]|nr:ROK family protein [Burkholderiaceae bacterium]
MSSRSQSAYPAAPRLGIDLGGTKTEVAVLVPGEPAPRLRRRVPTPRDDYAATVDAVAALVREAERELGERCTVGDGIPGTLSAATGRVKNANSTWLNGRPLREDLQRALGREVRIANDANCLAVSEAVDGAAAGRGLVFAAILGTGTGAGIAIGGRALAGAHGIAGEWGHVPLPAPRDDERPGPACWCGRHGCLETWLSGPGLAADHARVAGASIDAATLVAAAAAGDAACAASLDRWLDRLARGLAMVVNILDPDAIVLGGGLSNVEAAVRELPARIAPRVFSDAFVTPVLRAAHGDSSGVRGAARLWEG